jgi:DNA replication protein DnaC
MDTSAFILQIAKTAAQNTVIHDDDYQDHDGLWRCGRCGSPKQTRIDLSALGIDEPVTVFCMCACTEENYRRAQEESARHEKRQKLANKALSDMDSDAAKQMLLGRDDGSCPIMSELAVKYVRDWEQYKRSGKYGLILWGDTGVGKTFFATAIGNAIKQKGDTVVRISPAKLVEYMQGMYDTEKREHIDAIARADLVILDDLGAERDTPFSRECLFNVVEATLNAGKPIIVTTNLADGYMRSPVNRWGDRDDGYKRIFDRLLGACTPVNITGESHRRQAGMEARETMRGVYRAS